MPLYVLQWWLIHLRSSFIKARVEGFAEGLAEHASDPEEVRRSAEKYRREAGVTLSRENVLVTAGAKQALYNAAIDFSHARTQFNDTSENPER